MKNPRAALVATAIPLLLTSLRVTAGELPFNAPTTERAKESAPLLHQTARALHDSSPRANLPLLGGKQISDLWLFPTADANTVFARYNLTSNGDVTEHLTVLTLRDNKVVESRELTSRAAEPLSKRYASLDWSASIGTGHAAHTDTNSSSAGVPTSPHWTAGIGTGTATTSITNVSVTRQSTSSGTQPVVATAHWTSRIGSGDALDSSRLVVKASLAKAR